MVSEQQVIPTDKKVYATSIDAMKEAGIVIYFADQDTFRKLFKSKDKNSPLATLRG